MKSFFLTFANNCKYLCVFFFFFNYYYHFAHSLWDFSNPGYEAQILNHWITREVPQIIVYSNLTFEVGKKGYVYVADETWETRFFKKYAYAEKLFPTL